MSGVAIVLAFTMAASAMAGVDNPDAARQHWMLNCQGCHQPDASGSVGGAPDMSGMVSQFLAVEGGREYLIRVPGVASSGLADEPLTELVNWMLQTYDPAHVPADFKPYTSKEVGELRAKPFIREAGEIRAKLLYLLENTNNNKND